MVRHTLALCGVLHLQVGSRDPTSVQLSHNPGYDRRLNTFFSLSTTWKTYDVFNRQKMATFKSSRTAILELAFRYKDLISRIETKHEAANTKVGEVEEAERIIFTEICEICLWGNATDLSHWTDLTYNDVQRLQGLKACKEGERNILVNDLPLAFQVLKKAQRRSAGEHRRVDIVLDNAGFELFVDLILAGYLLSANLATTIVLHPKSIPWFVSDVIPKDFSDLLNALADPQAFFMTPLEDEDEKYAGKTLQPLSEQELDRLSFLFTQWNRFHAEGRLVIRHNRFWTEGGSYWRLPRTEPNLFEDLRNSELVIFKGDLNYGKLTADVSFPPLCGHRSLSCLTERDRQTLIGHVGSYHTIRKSNRTLGSILWYTKSGATNMQSRRCRRSTARQR